jgi:type I restriction enzyme S subunit
VSELPQGWVEASIADVTMPFASIDPTKTPEQKFRYADIGSIDNKTHTITDPKSFLGHDAPSRARRLIRTGDTLFSTVRTYLKNIALVPEDLDGELTSTGIAVLRPSDAVDAGYLFRWASSDDFVAPLSSAQDGTMYPAVSDRDVAAAPIPLPPLPEQRRIVAKIDSLTGKSRRARDHLDHIPRLVEKYKQAVLAAAFQGDLTREWRARSGAPSWTTVAVGSIIRDIVAGKNLRCEERPPMPHERGVVKVSAVTWGTFDPMATKTLPANFDPPEASRIRSGDFLISRANTLELVGSVVVVEHTPQNLFLSDKVLRLETDEAEKWWLMWFLRSPSGRSAIETGATGNQLSMRNLSQSALRNIEMPWPGREERTEIVRRVEIAVSWIDRLASEATSARRLIGQLNRAVLAKAFRGELVPQDPADEPASVLLERISAGRVAAPKTKRRRRAG